MSLELTTMVEGLVHGPWGNRVMLGGAEEEGLQLATTVAVHVRFPTNDRQLPAVVQATHNTSVDTFVLQLKAQDH